MLQKELRTLIVYAQIVQYQIRVIEFSLLAGNIERIATHQLLSSGHVREPKYGHYAATELA